jgi:hypothetical protein
LKVDFLDTYTREDLSHIGWFRQGKRRRDRIRSEAEPSAGPWTSGYIAYPLVLQLTLHPI